MNTDGPMARGLLIRLAGRLASSSATFDPRGQLISPLEERVEEPENGLRIFGGHVVEAIVAGMSSIVPQESDLVRKFPEYRVEMASVDGRFDLFN